MTIDQIIIDELAKFKAIWAALQAKNDLAATGLIFQAIDELVNFVENNYNVSGMQKKAMVIAAIDELYDFTAAAITPLWARPFEFLVKDFIVNKEVNVAIDFIVHKYNAGTWPAKDMIRLTIFLIVFVLLVIGTFLAHKWDDSTLAIIGYGAIGISFLLFLAFVFLAF